MPIGIPAIAGIGVIQVRIGHAKGQGVVHFYTTRHGRSDGNARISIKNTSGLKTARTALLTSEWFHDAQLGAITPYSKKAEVIYEKEGKMILPPSIPPQQRMTSRPFSRRSGTTWGRKEKPL